MCFKHNARRTLLILYVLASIGIGAHSLKAQATGGSLTGTIRGQSGAPLPGIPVSVKDTASGTVRSVTSDQNGFYNFPDLLAGTYELTIKSSGFVTQVWSPMAIAVGADRI